MYVLAFKCDAFLAYQLAEGDNTSLSVEVVSIDGWLSDLVLPSCSVSITQFS